MDIGDSIVILGALWSAIAGTYLILQHKYRHDAEIEEYRQMKISERRMQAPREWWQDAIVNATQNPEVMRQLLPMIPEGLLSGVLQNLGRK